MTGRGGDYSWVYIGLAILTGGAILYFLFFSSSSGYVNIKYRDDKVNILANNFEPLDKSDSTVKGSWYDSSNEYMVVKLSSTYYHYCGVSRTTWSDFKSATMPYGYYRDDIKGNFDCRINPVPEYK